MLKDSWYSKGSFLQSYVVLTASVFGPGVLFLPHCIAETGIIPGILLIVTSYVALTITQVILVSAAKDYSASNYGIAVFKAILSRFKSLNNGLACSDLHISDYKVRILVIAINIPIFIGMNIVLPGFFLVWCDFVENIVLSLTENYYILMIFSTKWFIMLLCSILMLPFVMKRELQASRYLCWISILSVIFLCSICIRRYLVDGPVKGAGNLILWNKNLNIFSICRTITLACFAFANHENAPAVSAELRAPKSVSIILAICVSTTALVIYLIIALISYATFRRTTMENIGLNFVSSDSFSILTRILLMLSNLVACTLSLHATIAALINIFVACFAMNSHDIEDSVDTNVGSRLLSLSGSTSAVTNNSLKLSDNDSTCDCNDNVENIKHEEIDYIIFANRNKYVSFVLSNQFRCLLVFIFIAITIIIALNVGGALIFIELAGGLFDSSIALVIPLIVYIYAYMNADGFWKYILNFFIITIILFCTSTCLFTSMWNIAYSIF